jgi:hypothetical protein
MAEQVPADAFRGGVEVPFGPLVALRPGGEQLVDPLGQRIELAVGVAGLGHAVGHQHQDVAGCEGHGPAGRVLGARLRQLAEAQGQPRLGGVEFHDPLGGHPDR